MINDLGAPVAVFSLEEISAALKDASSKKSSEDAKITSLMKKPFSPLKISGEKRIETGRQKEILRKATDESILQELVRRGDKKTALEFFTSKFLSNVSSVSFQELETTDQIEWLRSAHPHDSPLIIFFKEVGILDKRGLLNAKVPIQEVNESLKESLHVLKSLLKKESTIGEDSAFNYENLSELDLQMKEASYAKFTLFLQYGLRKAPTNPLYIKLTEITQKDSSVDQKILECKEVLKDNTEHSLYKILNQFFLNLQSIQSSSEATFLEISPLLTQLGVVWDRERPIVEQWRVRTAFQKEVERIIYAQYKEAIQTMNLHSLTDYDTYLSSSTQKNSLEEILKKTRDCIDRSSPPFKGQKELKKILNGEFCKEPLEAQVCSLHFNLLSYFMQKKDDGVAQSCYEKFYQFHFFLSSICESLLEDLSISQLDPLYAEFTKLTYLDSNAPILYWVLASLVYKRYQTSLQELENSPLKEILLSKEKQFEAQGLKVQERIQKIKDLLSQPDFAPIAASLEASLVWTFKQINIPDVFLKGLIPIAKTTVLSKQEKDVIVQTLLEKDQSEHFMFIDLWRKREAFLQQEEGSPFWLFLHSRNFFQKQLEGEPPYKTLQKFDKYQKIFLELAINQYSQLNGLTFFQSNNPSAINDFAKRTALDYVLDRVTRLEGPPLKLDLVDLFWKIDESDLSIKEKITQTQELLETVVHPEVESIKTLLTGGFIGSTGIDPILDKHFALKISEKATPVIHAFFQSMRIEDLTALSKDENYFEKKEAIKDLENWFFAHVSRDKEFQDELESVVDSDLEPLERVFQKIVKKGRLSLPDIMSSIHMQLDKKVKWMEEKTREYQLFSFREELLLADTGFKKMVALNKGFTLLQDKIKETVANPEYNSLIEEACLDYATAILDFMIKELGDRK